MSHELVPVPTSMFIDNGDMRICTAKSVLKKVLQSKVPVTHIEKEITCTVIDGSAGIYVILEDTANNMKDYSKKVLGGMCI